MKLSRQVGGTLYLLEVFIRFLRRFDRYFPRYCVLKFDVIREVDEKCARLLLVFYWELCSENFWVGATTKEFSMIITSFDQFDSSFWRGDLWMTPRGQIVGF